MKLTEVVAIWDVLPDYSNEHRAAITFEGFVNAVSDALGIENDISVLGGEDENDSST